MAKKSSREEIMKAMRKKHLKRKEKQSQNKISGQKTLDKFVTSKFMFDKSRISNNNFNTLSTPASKPARNGDREKYLTDIDLFKIRQKAYAPETRLCFGRARKKLRNFYHKRKFVFDLTNEHNPFSATNNDTSKDKPQSLDSCKEQDADDYIYEEDDNGESIGQDIPIKGVKASKIKKIKHNGNTAVQSHRYNKAKRTGKLVTLDEESGSESSIEMKIHKERLRV